MYRFLFLIILLIIIPETGNSQTTSTTKTIHIFAALCDNENQGIVPVSKKLGDGQNSKTNLYWGVLYGVKTHFKRSADWSFIKTIPSENSKILERVLFKHKHTDTYLLADAYDGRYIKEATTDFLKTASETYKTIHVTTDSKSLSFRNQAQLIGYIDYDGFIEFDLDITLTKNPNPKDAIILACISKDYFKPLSISNRSKPFSMDHRPYGS